MEQVADSVSPLLFRKEMRAALEAGVKIYTRRPVFPANSNVEPGSFGDVRWDTGRVKWVEGLPELRAQCEFSQGAVRVVSITPKIQPGHLFWVRESRYMRRDRSTMSTRVTTVSVSRITDITDQQALEEGVQFIRPSLRKTGTPRDWFARLWDDIHGEGTWSKNGWCWIYGLKLLPGNIDIHLIT
jgi:hypothetical protein